jgi:hypothetical protein
MKTTKALLKQQQCCLYFFIFETTKVIIARKNSTSIYFTQLQLWYSEDNQIFPSTFLISPKKWQIWSVSRLPRCWVWNSETHKRLHQTRCLSTPLKDQDTYYNIFQIYKQIWPMSNIKLPSKTKSASWILELTISDNELTKIITPWILNRKMQIKTG